LPMHSSRGDRGSVWFEDRWMVASWCDEWMTMLSGLTLAKYCRCRLRLDWCWCSNELARNVIAGDASRCGEDN
jgi:hypothetical protein